MAGKTQMMTVQLESGKKVQKRKWTNQELLQEIQRKHGRVILRLLPQVYDPRNSQPLGLHGKAIKVTCASPKDVWATLNYLEGKLDELLR